MVDKVKTIKDHESGNTPYLFPYSQWHRRRLKMRKISLCVAVTILCMSLIAGFSPVSCKQPAEVTIKFVTKIWDTPQAKNNKQLAQKFEEANPNINVKVTTIPWGQAYEKFTSMIMAGDIPHVAEGVDSETGLFDQLNIMLPLTEDQITALKEMGLDEIAFDVSTYSDGKIYNFPWLFWQYCIFYRKDRFQEAGIRIPETTDELLEASQKLTNSKEGTFGFSWRGYGGLSTMMPILMTYLGKTTWFDKDGNCVLDSPEGIAGIKWYYDLYKTSAPPESSSWGYDECSKAFWAGVTNMFANTSEVLKPTIERLGKDKVGVFRYPIGPSGKRYNLFSYLGYMRFKSDNPAENEASWKFMKYLLSEESLKTWADLRYSVPNAKVREVIYREEVYKPFGEELDRIDVIPVTYPYYLPEWQGFEFRSSEDIEALAIGDLTPAEVAKKWADEFTPSMKKFIKSHPDFDPLTGKMK